MKTENLNPPSFELETCKECYGEGCEYCNGTGAVEIDRYYFDEIRDADERELKNDNDE